jgi:hypothetical protein
MYTSKVPPPIPNGLDLNDKAAVERYLKTLTREKAAEFKLHYYILARSNYDAKINQVGIEENRRNNVKWFWYKFVPSILLASALISYLVLHFNHKIPF